MYIIYFGIFLPVFIICTWIKLYTRIYIVAIFFVKQPGMSLILDSAVLQINLKQKYMEICHTWHQKSYAVVFTQQKLISIVLACLCMKLQLDINHFLVSIQ